MDGLMLYLVFLIPPLVFGLVVQWWLKKTFARYSEVPVSTGMSGAQVARTILDRNGLSAMFPVVAFASNAWIWLLLIGAFMQALGLVAIALLLYGVAVLFHIVTLPVEFNASRRAAGQLRELGIVGAGGEQAGVQKVLTAAALTYVAGALAALTQLLYYALVFFGNRD
jgi:Zn-dependent membrane protease YugP